MELIIGLVVILILLYYYFTSTYNFWRDRGIVGPKPIVLLGTIKDVIFGKLSIGSYLKKVYDEYSNEPMVGIFTRWEPVLVLNDMELIKDVLIKDFKCFMDRGLKIHEKHEPLTAHLFFIEAKRWRVLRPKMTPVFTSGKLKDMFYLLTECANQLDKYLDQFDDKQVDIREISARFATDVIGVCAFGLQANALAEEDSLFRRMGKRIFENNPKNFVKFRLRNFAPKLYDVVGSWFTDYELNDFFIGITRDTIEYRKKNGIMRHDFIDLLAGLKEDWSKNNTDIELTDSLIAAQLFVFFIAGFETSSSTMSNCIFELAQNHDVQNKLRDEIKEEMENNKGVITYDGIKNMKYLDKVFNETLRKYPPVTSIMRKSTSKYTFPGTKVTIPEGTAVWIPSFAIQRDPKYYPDPDVFDPERFSEEEIKKRPAMAFLSFGDGPRNCIGARFGQMQTKVGIVKILQNHKVDVCEQTDKNYTINSRSFLLAPVNGVVVKIIKQ
ncbi:probable cytochrome P450 6a14 [Microplitis demolitor]|uniref:probable cytochrome P450 6a14 n=1 Tax=Microplitis demolitor TaxID=69319 RepID=UPI0004CDB9E3|nr:probable cytochrome P450 6a14 [Microplitis demolitor]